VKYHWLILSLFSIFVGHSPADATKLLSWRFDSNQNQLTIRTDTGVQPVVKLIGNPARLVIDLPGTVADLRQADQMLGGAIKSVRVGQFEANTARLVLELAPGYTINPEEVKIRGLSSTQWVLDVPQPVEITQETRTASKEVKTDEQNLTVSPSPDIESKNFQVTKNGLFVRFDKREGSQIDVKRSKDRRQIEIDLNGVTLPQDLTSRAIALNQYGVEQIEFIQTSNAPAIARLILNVSEDSPDWIASYTRVGDGGLVLLPKSTSSNSRQNSSATRPIATTPTRNNQRIPTQTKAIVEGVTLAANNSELIINSSEKVEAQGSWRANGVYEIRMSNAQLAANYTSPQITANSPISRLRVWQESDDTVVILIHPALGVRLDGDIQQPSEQMLVLKLSEFSRISRAVEPVPTPPSEQSLPLQRAWDRMGNSQIPNEKIVVVIDPGHGGKDPGAIGINGVREKDLILPISQQVADILELQGIQVIMTRNDDRYISLQDRSKMANRANADLFISIHANSMGMSRPDISGLETYYLEDGMRLAESIHHTILKNVDVKNRRIRRARFYVLRHTQMPAVLVEIGFLTGKEDAQKLANQTYRDQMAQAIADGILQYVRKGK
jgi:N-acetylmuramoyl-L-alanine amidase